MTNFGYYTQSGTGPLSWGGVRRGTERHIEEDFKKHASKFYRGRSKGKGLLSKIFGSIKKTGQHKSKRGYQRPGESGRYQRPGNVGFGELDGFSKSHVLLLAALVAAFIYFRK